MASLVETEAVPVGLYAWKDPLFKFGGNFFVLSGFDGLRQLEQDLALDSHAQVGVDLVDWRLQQVIVETVVARLLITSSPGFMLVSRTIAFCCSLLEPNFQHFYSKMSFLVQIKFFTEDSEQTHKQILILN